MVDIDELRTLIKFLDGTAPLNEIDGKWFGDHKEVNERSTTAFWWREKLPDLELALNELATLRTANQWLDIADAPDDGTDLLVKVTHSLGDGEWETLYWVDWQVADDAWPVFRERIDIPFPPTHYRLIQD